MGIKAFNHGDDFVNKFVRAIISDSTGLDAVTPKGPGPSPITATGGVISDYTTPPGSIFRAHVFTSSGTFDITDGKENIEYLVVAGGGGGGTHYGGGGGAGGLRTNLSGHPLAGGALEVSATGGPGSDGSYPVTVGAGGNGAATGPNGGGPAGGPGNNSVFDTITSHGGGGGSYGGNTVPIPSVPRAGGSGGGGGGEGPGVPVG